MAKIVIAGANGFVGKNLIPALVAHHSVRALGRNSPAKPIPDVDWQKADLFSAESTAKALQGMEIAIYLVHSMMPSSRLFQGKFHDTDLILADNFANACRINGIKQIIYLGGLIPEGYISPHLESRLEVENVLKTSGVPVTALRCGMIVGPSGSSFEILRSIVKKLPVMILPKWTESSTQAIFIDDVVSTVKVAIENPAFYEKTIDVVNGESLTYEDILKQAALALQLKRFMFKVPIASTGFSKLWVQLFGNSTYELVSPLIDSLQCNMPQLDPVPEIRSIIKYTRFQEMVEETIRRDKVGATTRPRRRLMNQDSVRSIQRLPTIQKDCQWIASEYMRWLPDYFHTLIRIKVFADNNQIAFHFLFFSRPLLVLKRVHETMSIQREKFHIIDGLLTKTKNTGWLEFRQVNNKKHTLVSINEFIPSLPWLIYTWTQAPLHKLVMLAFGKHLVRIQNAETQNESKSLA